MSNFKICVFSCLASILLLSGCSLNYDSEREEKVTAPDFLFENFTLTKVEEGQTSAMVHASTIEQYSNSGMSYAEGVQFRLFNKNDQIEIEGKCDLLSIDTKNEIYTLFDNICISSFSQNMKISSKGLKWNNKTEQLTTPKDSLVTISNDIDREGADYAPAENANDRAMSFTGTNFSASGISKKYTFGKKIRGTIEIGESDE